MMELSLGNLPVILKMEFLEDILRKLFDTFNINAKFSWISTIFCNYKYYESSLDFILELLKKNQMDQKDTISDLFFLDVFNLGKHDYDNDTRVKNSIEYLKFLENFLPKEQIVSTLLEKAYYLEFISKLNNEGGEYLSTFLDSYPIPFEKFSIGNFLSKNIFTSILGFLSTIKRRGYAFPEAHIEKMLKKDMWYYSKQSTGIIRYMLDNYGHDIYELDDRNTFFTDFVNSFSQCSFEEIKEEFESLFGGRPIDLEKLGNNHPNIFTECTTTMLLHIYSAPDPVAFVEFCQKRFVQNIFDLRTVSNVLEQYGQHEDNPLIKRLLYETAIHHEDVKLSDHVSKLLQEKPELLEETTDQFTNYLQNDIKFAIALYLFCKD